MNLTRHGNNAEIQVHVQEDHAMRKLGFTDSREGYWYKSVSLDGDITFNITIAKDRSDWRIDILDEDYGQPYDYQHMIASKSKNAYPYMIWYLVCNEMKKLIEAGIISNWSWYDYL